MDEKDIRSDPRQQPAGGGDALAALEKLQSSLRARNVDLEQWALDVESERQATGLHRGAAPRRN
ncbi:MAG: hypothetical protein F4Y45_14410 [Acidobacteria bacterium]|nr:hypothetical protein [Acidobacteriota bacterium]MYJ03165.1 hypothetical protein [Acidobacteriota bacterium]